MGRRSSSAAVAALVSLALAAPAAADSRDPINGYRVKATPQNLEKLAMAGFDVTEGIRGRQVEIFGTAEQISKLKADGIRAKVVRDRKGRTAAQRQRSFYGARAAQAPVADDSAYQVWTRYDRVRNDGKEQYLEQYDRLLRQYPKITKDVVLGRTHQGRDIIAIKVTRNADKTKDGKRPAVLYNAQQHAREWLAGETCRRTLDYFVTSYGDNARVTRLVDSRELWFMCMANPDGHEYTFTPGNRLWRKNMADNDGDGVRGEPNDGVDPNRNFATNFGLDDEGSSPDPSSETYRGPGPDSEPETKAMKRLWDRVDFTFQKNDHTAAELLLWPQGFQKFTPTPDNGIFEALAGHDHESAIQDDEETFDPDLSSELYITNGDALDDAYRHGILGFTPEGTESRVPGVTGFEFEDDEQEVQEEFERHLAFSLDLAESAEKPEDPESHLGNETEDFYLDRFAKSYGDPQPIQVTAKRSLGRVFLHYRINGGNEQRVRTTEFKGGERYYRETGHYYHRLRGVVEGTRPGQEVTAWFENANGKRRSSRFTYETASESRRRALVIADENYSGPVQDPVTDTEGPDYADEAVAALEANGIRADVYDVDAEDMTAPHPLGVLSHYDLVVWEKGDDYVTRRPGQPGQTGQARVAIETQLAVRDFINEGGKLLYTGQHAGRQDAEGYEFRNFGFPEPDESAQGRWCGGADPEAVDGCIPPDNDFQQYYLGAYIYVSGGNATDAEGNPYPILGEGDPFGPSAFELNGADSADNQVHTATYAVTSTILDPAQYPTFADSRRLAVWDREGAGPFSPYTGDYYMAANADDAAFKRLRREIDLTGKSSGELSFRTSYDLENHWDYVFVEVHEVGSDQWTTLPDANGHTTQDTGDSCPTASPNSNWQSLHPFLAHYQTITGPDSCVPTGTTGAWHASTGNSNGWQDWKVDLTAYAGKRIEVSISVASDPATTGLGLWLDDAKVTADGATVAETSFEADTGGWTIGPPPEGTDNPENGWERTTEQFQEGAVVATDETVYTGFGFEGIRGAAKRAEFMGGVLEHLGLTD
jgi:Zinc carboxypeptidase/Immune inhibitor A peptidase M6